MSSDSSAIPIVIYFIVIHHDVNSPILSIADFINNFVSRLHFESLFDNSKIFQTDVKSFDQRCLLSISRITLNKSVLSERDLISIKARENCRSLFGRICKRRPTFDNASHKYILPYLQSVLKTVFQAFVVYSSRNLSNHEITRHLK